MEDNEKAVSQHEMQLLESRALQSGRHVHPHACKSDKPPFYQHPETNTFIRSFIQSLWPLHSVRGGLEGRTCCNLCTSAALKHSANFLLSHRPLKGRELKWKALSFLAFLPPRSPPLAIIFPISSPFQKQPIMGDWRLSICFSAKSREGGRERERGRGERERERRLIILD